MDPKKQNSKYNEFRRFIYSYTLYILYFYHEFLFELYILCDLFATHLNCFF